MCPDLPGHGADETAPSKVTMRSYTDAVERVLKALTEPATLIGHSLGGVVVSQVCESMPEQVRKAVYLCAFLLRDGESVWRHEPPAASAPSVLSKPNLRLDDKKRTLDIAPAAIRKGFYNGCSPQDIEAAMARWRPEPLAPMLTPLSLTPERFGRVPRAYLACEQDRVIPLAAQQHMCRRTPCEVIATMSTGHSPFLSQPEVLASALDGL